MAYVKSAVTVFLSYVVVELIVRTVAYQYQVSVVSVYDWLINLNLRLTYWIKIYIGQRYYTLEESPALVSKNGIGAHSTMNQSRRYRKTVFVRFNNFTAQSCISEPLPPAYWKATCYSPISSYKRNSEIIFF